MAGQGAVQFRKKFVHTRSALNVFAMHMARGMLKMQSILKNVDCIVEVHDARIPISGRNGRFDDTMAARPRLLLLNKIDLIGSHHLENIKSYIRSCDPSVKEILYSSCKSDVDNTIKKELLPTILKTIKSSDRYNRSETLDYNVLVIGIPNVGKSTLINALRSTHLGKGGRATPVGAKPGITKSVMERIKVSEAPKVYVLDTPGILPPSIPNMDVAFKLSICDTIRENILGVTELADYLLYYLNRYQNFSYVDLYELPNPVDDVFMLLIYISKKFNMIMKVKSQTGGSYAIRPDFAEASLKFLRDFRGGKHGKIMLDEDLIQSRQ